MMRGRLCTRLGSEGPRHRWSSAFAWQPRWSGRDEAKRYDSIIEILALNYIIIRAVSRAASHLWSDDMIRNSVQSLGGVAQSKTLLPLDWMVSVLCDRSKKLSFSLSLSLRSTLISIIYVCMQCHLWHILPPPRKLSILLSLLVCTSASTITSQSCMNFREICWGSKGRVRVTNP